VIGASGLSDDDDSQDDALKWKLAESVRWQNNIFPASPLSSYSKFKIRFFKLAMTKEFISKISLMKYSKRKFKF